MEAVVFSPSAPVLAHPDTGRPFVVEVDASDSGIGAVLSQRAAEDEKPHPCAFFSRRLSPAEANYDAGNRELLALHEALVEWRHWLEGANRTHGPPQPDLYQRDPSAERPTGQVVPVFYPFPVFPVLSPGIS